MKPRDKVLARIDVLEKAIGVPGVETSKNRMEWFLSLPWTEEELEDGLCADIQSEIMSYTGNSVERRKEIRETIRDYLWLLED